MKFTYTMKHFMRHTSSIIFLSGFFVDMFLLPEVENPITKYIGLAYLLTIGAAIYIREALVSRNTATQIEQKLFSTLTFGIAFFSGSILSFVFVYYFRSAELTVSWPFFVLLLGIMLLNELVSSHSFRFSLDVGVLMVASVFYAIFNVPIIAHLVNDEIFVISIVVSTLCTFAYLYILRFSSEVALDYTRKMQALAAVIPLTVAFLYFSNLIPAVPLSLKEAGIYHKVYRDNNGEYVLEMEEKARFTLFKTPVFHMGPNDSAVYFYNSVHAPTDITAPITHVWEEYNPTTKAWITRANISFTLSGGRSDGYRAYSEKDGITEGLWRVTVKVGQNRIVGRLTFKVVKNV